MTDLHMLQLIIANIRLSVNIPGISPSWENPQNFHENFNMWLYDNHTKT